MYLKKLHVHNFKSFAGTTDIPFAPGLTGVAGPNGMGKSNIADAILFVLGPSSSKALRADKLTSLFYNGGKEGKPATECEVSLVFDNSDRMMAVDSDEVEITRYVRAAPNANDPEGYYSYFYINGHRCNQSEIDTILSRARLSAEGYNIVKQGEVTRIVAMSPLDRRLLVEHLAGIAQYDEELQKAAEKREELEGNLGQLKTLLGEVERHMAELDGQRTQAIRYRDLDGEKKAIEAALALTNLSKLRGEFANYEKRLEEVSANLETLKAHLEEVRNGKTKVQKDINEVDDEIARRGGEEAVKVKAEKDQRLLEVGRLELTLDNAKASQTNLTAEKASIEKELVTRKKELDTLQANVKSLTAKVEEIDEKVTGHSKEFESANAPKDLSPKLVELRRSILQNEQDQASKGKAWQEAFQKIEQAKAEATALEHEKAVAEEDLSVRQAEVRDVEFRLKDLTSSRKGGERNVQSSTEELHSLRAKEKALTQRADKLKIELLELNRDYAALDAKLKERGGSGGSPMMATDFLMTQNNLGRIHGIRGKVEDLVTVDPEYSTAIAVAGGNRFQSLVVENDEIAAQCIELLNKEKKGRVTLLPLNKMTPGRPKGKALVVQKSPGCRGFALDIVKYDPSLESALWFVFGETLIMDNLDNARKIMGGVRLVTLRGELVESSGAMTGGFLGTLGKPKGSENAATLQRLSEELGAKSAEDASVAAELKAVSQRVKELSEELAKHAGEVTGSASALDDLQKDLPRVRQRLKDAEERVKTAGDQLTKVSKGLETLEAEAKELQDDLTKLKATREELQKQYLDSLPAAQSARMKKLQEESTRLNDERVGLHRELEGAIAAANTASETLKARQDALGKLKESLSTGASELKKIQKSLAEAREKLTAIEKVAETQNQASKALATKKDGLSNEFTRLSSEEAATEAKVQTHDGMLSEFTIRRDAVKKTLDEEEAAVKDFPEPKPEYKGKSTEELKQMCDEKAQAIAALGMVNAQAIEQYDSEKKRLDDFQGEVSRIQEERSGLMKLTRDLEQKKRTRLREVIKGVDANYRQIYTELSGGGEGELLMENPDDPLAGGLLIKAMPAGKKAQRLEQLSGGEKSLASLAFIFALQRYDPSPLYTLDEVDMSLDGINAENIGRMLRRNSSKAQFIVISLRKVTLKWAEHLFGVTMKANGVSQVIGLNLDDIKDVDEKEMNTVATRESATDRVGSEAK
jgi:chromosome segregation protein